MMIVIPTKEELADIIQAFKQTIQKINVDTTRKEAGYICCHLMKYPQALRYFEENRPAENLHQEFYAKPIFRKKTAPGCHLYRGAWWDNGASGHSYSVNVVICNEERRLFLCHLIKQLEEQIKSY